MALLLMLTSSMVLIETDSWQLSFYNTTIATVVFVVAFAAIMQSGVVGLAATMEPQFMQVDSDLCSVLWMDGEATALWIVNFIC